MNDEKIAKAQAVYDQGGLVAEEDADNVRIHLAVDANKPWLVFDKLNELELKLIKEAGNDLEKIKKASDFVDDVRARTKLMLENAGLSIEPPKSP
jgi:hypothetical protein